MSKKQIGQILSYVEDIEEYLDNLKNYCEDIFNKDTHTNIIDLPIQPIIIDKNGTPRFKENLLVRALLDYGQRTGFGLNELCLKFDSDIYKEEWNQLAQLIGYSISGFGDLSYAYNSIVREADAIADELTRGEDSE